MSEEISVIAVAQAKPGSEHEVETAIRACVGPTRQEAGCLLYTANSDVEDPSRFVFVERWTSRAALASHERAPHFLAMAKVFETRLSAPLQILILKELAQSS